MKPVSWFNQLRQIDSGLQRLGMAERGTFVKKLEDRRSEDSVADKKIRVNENAAVLMAKN